MILRVVTLAAGLSGAAGFSQLPEFTQQYVQRLGGAVDALDQVVADFDASAATAGLTRDAALAQMTGTAFLERRRADMSATFARHARLRADLDVLRRAGPFTRAYHMARPDPGIARAAWQEFRPAVPLTPAGAIFTGVGFLTGSLLAGAFLGLVRRLRPRSRTPA